MLYRIRNWFGLLSEKEKKHFVVAFLLVVITSLAFPSLIFLQNNQKTRSIFTSAVETKNTSKKGMAGAYPIQSDLGNSYNLKIAWYYSWTWIPFERTIADESLFHQLYWNSPDLQFVPTWTQKEYFKLLGINSCRTPEDKKKVFDKVAARMDILCTFGYCGQNFNSGYHIIGNEPDGTASDQDGTPNSVDLPKDAAECYGTIIRAIRSKSPTAQFIILGLSDEDRWQNQNFLEGFIYNWKQIWYGTEIGNLADVVKGWHLHTYYNNAYYGHSYASCPTDDSWPRTYLSDIDGLMQSYFGKKVPNQELWITEMGSLFNIPNPGTLERSKFLNLMECLVNVYENSPIVNRYAWFYAGNPENQWWGDKKSISLYSYNSWRYDITDLGLKYASIPVVSSPTATPRPTVTVTPAANPTQPPGGVCTTSVTSTQDVSQTDAGSASVVVYNNWDATGPSLVFTPNNRGYLDKIELVGSGEVGAGIGVRVFNLSTNKNITEIKYYTLPTTFTGKKWFTIDFTTEPELVPGTQYRIAFAGSTPDKKFYLFRKTGTFNWGFKTYIRSCGSSEGTTPTITPIPTVTLVPTATPTTSGNSIPVITTSRYVSYPSFTADGYDLNTQDMLTMKIYGLAPGMLVDKCTQSISGGKKTIKCTFKGTPTKGTYNGNINLSDDKGASIKKDFVLTVL